MLKRLAATTIILGALTGAAMATAKPVPLVWSTAWSGAEYVINGAVDNEPESAMFLARCEPAKPSAEKIGVHLWFSIDRELFPGQRKDADGMRKPYHPRQVAVIVDGKPYDVSGTTLTPEENTGGHELSLEVTLDSPLLGALRNGKTVSARVDDFTTAPLSLKRAGKKFDDFAVKCRKPRR